MAEKHTMGILFSGKVCMQEIAFFYRNNQYLAFVF